MIKIIWISFAALAGLWTLLVAITAEIVGWSFSLISTSQIGDVSQGELSLQVPLWLTPWIEQSTVNSFETSVTYVAQWLNSLLPNSVYVGDLLIVLTWIFWAVVIILMLLIALVAHWITSRA